MTSQLAHFELKMLQFRRDRLPPINLSTYNEDFLFYTFYNSFGDVLQIEAAEELYANVFL